MNENELENQNTGDLTEGVTSEENASLESAAGGLPTEETAVTAEDEQPPKKRPVALLVIFNVTVSLILAASLLWTAVLGMGIYLFQDMLYDVNFPKPNDYENLGIDPEIIEKLPTDKITNIALFGVDYAEHEDQDEVITTFGRSDAIIILSINETDRTIKLTSILRDSWVPIEINGADRYCKINAAYENGGALLAVKTLNRHFGLDISEYVTVSFAQLLTVIDKLGGIELEITEKERLFMNDHPWVNYVKAEPVEKSGYVHLNGRQAVVYSRIRKLDGEVSRTQRQQKVLFAILKKIQSKPLTQYPELLRSMLANVETSMSYDEILGYTDLVLANDLKLNNITVPGGAVPAERGVFDDTNGLWVYKYDLKTAQEFIHEWIYGTTEFNNSDLESTITTRPDPPKPSQPSPSSDTQSSNGSSSEPTSSNETSSDQTASDNTASDPVSSDLSNGSQVSSSETSSDIPTEGDTTDTSSDTEVNSQDQSSENTSQGG